MRVDPLRVPTILRRLGGVGSYGQLREWGVSDHTVRRALADRLVVKVRRGWLALPDADPHLVVAAREGVVISCVTQAHRLGLWVREQPGLHVAAPQGSGRVDLAGVVHWARPVVPRPPGVLDDQIENVLALVANCQPFEEALATWESAMRKDLVSAAELSRLRLSPNARRLVELACPWSDSGLETIAVSRLRFLRLPMTVQASVLGRRVDLLIGNRLIVEIDGNTHTGPKRDRDIEFDARARLHGYHVIRVSYRQILDDWPAVQRLIMLAVAQGLHLAA